MNNSTKLLIIAAGAISLLLFPFLLNWLLLRKPLVPVVGDGTTWLTFWPVYLSAIASFGMIYMTYLSLKQSRQHIEDLKKRDEEESRARLVFSVIVYQTAFYLRIFNIGEENAFNVKLDFNKEFIDEIEVKYRKYYTQLSRPDFIEAGKSIYILIGWCEDVNKAWEGKDIVLAVKGSFNDKYTIDEKLDMGYFIGKTHFLVKGDLETTVDFMKKGLVVPNNGFKPVQKSLDEIASTMVRIEYTLSQLGEHLKEKGSPKEDYGDTLMVGEIQEQSEGEDLKGIMTD